MSKEAIVIALGLIVVVTTQLGIPSSLRMIILIIAGIGIMVVGFFLRAESLSRGSKRTSRHSFVENGVHATSDTLHEQKGGINASN